MSIFKVSLVFVSVINTCSLNVTKVVHSERKRLLVKSLKDVAEIDTKVIYKYCIFVDLDELQMSPKVQNILNSIKCPYVSLRIGETLETMGNSVIPPTYFFYVLNSLEDVHKKLEFASTLKVHSTRVPSFFIINFDIKYEVAWNFMKDLWKQYSLYCSVLIIFKKKVTVITYQPFKNVLIDLTDVEQFKNYFASHQYANLNGKVFNLAVFNNPPRNLKKGSRWTGADPNFWIDLIDSLNASWKLVQTKNFSYKDAMRAVGDGKADFCPYRYFPVGDYKDVEFLTPFVIDYIVGLVPNAKKLPNFFNILTVSESSFWILTSLSFISLVLAMIIAGKSFNRQIFLAVFGICLNQSVKKLRSYQTIQIFLINLWQFSCLIISATFQGFLLDNLLITKYEPQIEKITDLIESNLTTYVIADMRTLVETTIPKLSKQLVSASDEEISRILMDYQADCAVLLPFYSAYAIVHKFRRIRNCHIMRQNLIPGLPSYFFRKNSPYIGIFGEMISRHFQYGLASVSYDFRRIERDKNEESVNLSFSHLQAVFCGILIGLVISFVVFILENLIFLIRKVYK